MFKISLFICFTSLLLLSCDTNKRITTDFNCDIKTSGILENVTDVKELFSIKIPVNWKTNLYQDEIQSSIFSADTTKQLSETVLLDVTFMEKNVNFNEAFKLKQEQENLSKNLITIRSKDLLLLNKPAYYMLLKGKKGKFNYQVCNTFIKVNSSNFILAKTEVYGDSLVNSRLCKSFSLIENIKILQ